MFERVQFICLEREQFSIDSVRLLWLKPGTGRGVLQTSVADPVAS